MIVEKFRQEMWEKKKGNLGKIWSNLCQGLSTTIINLVYVKQQQIALAKQIASANTL